MATINFDELGVDKTLSISWNLLAEFEKNGIKNLEGEMKGTNLFRAYIPDPFTGSGLVGDGGYFLLSSKSSSGFTWPGGSPDIGEVPTNAIGGIGIQDLSPNRSVASFSGLNLLPSDLLKVHSKTELAELLFKGHDNVTLMNQKNGTSISTYGGNDTVQISSDKANTGRSMEVHGGTGRDEIFGLSGMKSGLNHFYGDAGNDTLHGSSTYFSFGAFTHNGGQDVLNGGTGNDKLYGDTGNDRLIGGAGNDLLDGGRFNGSADTTGSGWVDRMSGGAGADTFAFTFAVSGNKQYFDSGLKAGQRDVIIDFQHGVDHILVESVTETRFRFVGTHDFTAANQIRYERTDDGITAFFNVDADKAAEFAIDLDGATTLTGGDFRFDYGIL